MKKSKKKQTKKVYFVSFSGGVEVKAKNKEEAWEAVTNEMILDNIEMEQIDEII